MSGGWSGGSVYRIPGGFGVGQGAAARYYLEGTADPSAGAGVAAPISSLYSRNNAGTGETWQKTGAAATAWAILGGGGVTSGAIIRNPGGAQTHQLTTNDGGFTWPDIVSNPSGIAQPYGSALSVFDPAATVFRVSKAGVWHVTLNLALMDQGGSGEWAPPSISFRGDGTMADQVATNILPYVYLPTFQVNGTFCWEGILDPADAAYGAVIGFTSQVALGAFDDTLYGQCQMSIHYVRPR